MASASSKQSAAASSAANATSLKRNSDDMGWEFGVLYDPEDLQRVKCKLCGKEMGEGISRLKQHVGQIRGHVASCTVATKEQQKRCKDSCEAARIKKKLKQQHEEELRAEVNKQIVEVGEDDDNEEELASIGKGGSRKTGPMDQYVHPIDPSIPLAKNKFQQTINEIIDKQRSYLEDDDNEEELATLL